MSQDPERPDSPGTGPQSPAPPAGPQSPPPESPVAPPPAQQPAGPQSPAPGGYGGPVPPGGWQQPVGAAPPQAVAASPGQLAGWGARLGAYLIDALIIAVPFLIIFFALVAGAVGFGESNDDAAAGGLIAGGILTVLTFAAVALLYAPLLMRRDGERNGQTWGKQIIGIRAVRDNGQAWSFGSAALREVVIKGLAVGIASSIIPLIPWFLNFFWPLWDDQNRALHDMAVSSHVVKA